MSGPSPNAQQFERFNALLHAIYEGAVNAAAWPGILAAVTDWLGGEKGLLITSNMVLEKGGFAYAHRIPQSSIALWSTRYAGQNLWIQALVARGLATAGSAFTGSELVPDEAMLESDWYQNLLAPDDILHLVGGVVHGEEHPDMPFVALGVFRGRSSAAFHGDDRDRMRQLLPHLSRAMGVMFKLRDAEFRVAASLHSLDQIRAGILLMDEQGHVCFANTEARRVCRQRDGLSLAGAGRSLGALQAEDPAAHAAIHRALRAAARMDPDDADHFAHAICVQRPSGLPDYRVQISSLPEPNPFQLTDAMPRSILFIKDGAKIARPDAELLMRNYALTLAEARLALALFDGLRLDAVATEFQVSVNTLKTHLKSVYGKLSVTSRAGLTRLLASLGSH
jgi:DNA-binding CsgD family transcriptional regulator